METNEAEMIKDGVNKIKECLRDTNTLWETDNKPFNPPTFGYVTALELLLSGKKMQRAVHVWPLFLKDGKLMYRATNPLGSVAKEWEYIIDIEDRIAYDWFIVE